MNQENPAFAQFLIRGRKEMTQAKKTPAGVYTYPSPSSDPPPIVIHVYEFGGIVAFYDDLLHSVTYNTGDTVHFAQDKVFPFSFRVLKIETHDGLVVECD